MDKATCPRCGADTFIVRTGFNWSGLGKFLIFNLFTLGIFIWTFPFFLIYWLCTAYKPKWVCLNCGYTWDNIAIIKEKNKKPINKKEEFIKGIFVSFLICCAILCATLA